jgi:hypothetical protein
MAPTAASTPNTPQSPPGDPAKTQPIANRPAGTKVATEATPSRDSHDVRH